MNRLRAAAAWALAPRRRWFLAAVVAGVLLRLAWVVWVVADPSQPLSDTAQHLSMADQFSRLATYRINGELSAYHAPGYPFLLAPVVALARLTGWFSPVFGAALVNVAAAGATIALGGELARRWIGDAARTPAAWLLAVAAGPVYLTAVALNETVHTAVVLGALLLVTVVLQSPWPAARGRLVALGLLVGYAVLVRATGAVLLVIAVIALRRAAGSWRAALRPALAVIGLSLLVVGPWVLRNGLQVGVWAPSGNGAAFLCHGHGDHAEADEEDLTDAEISDCFRGTAYGPDPDEGRWYRETVDEAVRWALAHPGEELRLTWDKTVVLYADDSQALADAADFGARRFGSDLTMRRLDQAADAWHRSVLLLAVAGLVLSAGARRAWPLWGTVIGLTMAVWGGSVLDRYHHTIMAIATVFASATLVAMGRWASAGIRSTTGEGDDEGDGDADDTPVDAADGLARASRPRGRLGGPADHPFLPVVTGVALGAWVCALGFDAFSFVADTEWVYARGAWLLTGLGLLAGLVGAFLALDELLGIPRDTVAFRVGVRRLVALDVALVAFTVSFLVRNDSDFLFHDPSPTLAVLASLLGLSAAAWSTWQAGILTYRYGVRVALDDERVKGFEPVRE